MAAKRREMVENLPSVSRFLKVFSNSSSSDGSSSSNNNSNNSSIVISKML